MTSKKLVSDYISKMGGKQITDFVNFSKPVIVKCKKGHEFTLKLADVKKEKWCDECVTKSPLDILKDILDRNSVEYKSNKDTIIIEKDKQLIPITSGRFKVENGNLIIPVSEDESRIMKEIESYIVSSTCDDNDLKSEDILNTETDKNDKRPKCVGYVRVSTDMQVDGGKSLEAQQTEIREYARKNKYNLIKTYVDKGVSAKDTDRPLLKQMMSEIEPQTKVIISNLSRLSRNTRDALNIANELAQKLCYIISLQENFNTETDAIKFQIYCIMAEQERNQISSRIKATMRDMSNKKTLVTKPPFGWRSPGKGLPLEPHPEEMEVIEKLKDLRSKYSEETVSSFCQIVNKAGLKCRKAKKWYPSSLQKIMQTNNIE